MICGHVLPYSVDRLVTVYGIEDIPNLVLNASLHEASYVRQRLYFYVCVQVDQFIFS